MSTTTTDTEPDRHPIEMVWHDLTPRLMEVVRVTRLTPRMARITLGGADLTDFAHGAADDHVKLFFPRPGEELPVMPTLGEDGLVPPPPGSPQPTFRDYTVRYVRPEGGELDIDFALHGHGPGASWAATAVPGRKIGVLGPRGSYVNPLDFDWYLFGADETALPALGAWLERLPAGVPAHAVVEVEDEAERQPLPEREGLTVEWVFRTPAVRSADPTRSPGQDSAPNAAAEGPMEAAIKRFVPPRGDGFVWIGGEAGALKPIRRHVRGYGLRKNWVDVDGYWKRGVVNHNHHVDED